MSDELIGSFGEAFSRRTAFRFLIGGSSVWLTAGIPYLPALQAVTGDLQQSSDQTVLVVIQLTGGNDTLNTLVPYADDSYHRARPVLRAVAKDVLKIDDYLGLHRRMTALAELFAQGRVAIVQGVGYPNSNRDHGRAMHDWQTGRPEDQAAQTGWVGRILDRHFSEKVELLPAIFVGSMPLPLALTGELSFVPRIQRAQDLVLPPGVDRRLVERFLTSFGGSKVANNPWWDAVRRSTAAGLRLGQKVQAALDEHFAPAGPPLRDTRFELARRLGLISTLIKADIGVRIFYTDLGGVEPGGFDNHANQLGNHCSLLEELSESIAGFFRELDRHRLSERVVVVTFSEFGRTLQENGRHGTDHGAAQSLFLVGGRVRSGIFGKHPSLSNLDQGGLRHHTDFRSVLATLVEQWLGFETGPAFAGNFPLLDLFRG